MEGNDINWFNSSGEPSGTLIWIIGFVKTDVRICRNDVLNGKWGLGILGNVV